MPEFIPGLQLSELYYQEAVKPILEAAFPQLVYSASLIGPGSEVLGYDTPQSMDHNWGPKVLLFVKADDHERYQQAIREVLSQQLPYEIYGISTNFDPPDTTSSLSCRVSNVVYLLRRTGKRRVILT